MTFAPSDSPADAAGGHHPSRDFEDAALRVLPDVARFALSLTRVESDADDLVQETYLRAFRAWHTFQPGTDMRRWLFTICKHHFLRLRHQDARFAELDGEGDPDRETLAAVRLHASLRAAGDEALFDRLDVGPAIRRAIDALPAPFRVAVILVDVEGYTYEDAAAVLEVPVGTVRSRLFRGRRLLQEALVAHARDAGLTTLPTVAAP
jgi:RNA polymerase sigma-70 factor (ECF subfamily)